MSQNPLQSLFQIFEKVSTSVQTHLFNFMGQHHHPLLSNDKSILSVSSSLSSSKVNSSPNTDSIHILLKGKSSGPVTKEELGRATWTFLHTLAAQYPENPTRQQKKDVKELMAILSRMYPCKECADHFKEVLSTCLTEQIPYKPDLMMTFPNGFVMCTMLLTEALVNWYFHVSVLMQGGASLSASIVPVTYKGLQQILVNKHGRFSYCNLPMDAGCVLIMVNIVIYVNADDHIDLSIGNHSEQHSIDFVGIVL